MKKIILRLLCVWPMLIMFMKGGAQSNISENSQLVGQWESATYKNIDSLLIFSHGLPDSSFYYKILINARNFIAGQSRKEGVRSEFIEKILQSPGFSPSLFNDAYIVEHYRSGETFKAEFFLYCLSDKKGVYKYALKSGKLKLTLSVDFIDKSIIPAFHSIGAYLCKEYYASESIFITRVNKQSFTSKVLVFPCSKDFIRLKKMLKLF